MTNTTVLLVALLVCHYLADFCLTMPVMIQAKADGRNLWLIALHATIHAFLMGLLCLLIYGIDWQFIFLMMLFGIDIPFQHRYGKGSYEHSLSIFV